MRLGEPAPRSCLPGIGACGLLAVGLRLGIGLGLGAGAPPPVGDGGHFDRIARALVAGQGFGESRGHPTSHRAPLWPLWLAGLYRLAGPSAEAGVLGAALLGGVTTVGTGLLARLLGGSRAGVAAAAATAVYPRLVDYATRLWSLSETLAVPLLVAALVAWAGCERRAAMPAGAGATPAALLGGVLFGLLALCRPVMTLLPLVLLARWRRAGGRLVLAALVAYLVTLAPWTVRNYRLWGRIIPVSTMSGIVFYQGFHPPPEGWGFTPWDEIHRLAGPGLSEPEMSDLLVRRTLADVAARPGAALALLPLKLLSLGNPFSERTGRLDGAWLAIALLGLGGAYRLRREPRAVVPLLSLVYLIFFALVFYGSARFRLPGEPVLLALGAAWLAGPAGGGAWRPALAAAALLVGLGLVPGLERARLGRQVEGWIGPLPGLSSAAPGPPTGGRPGG